MLRAETAMHAAPPASYKRKIQRAPDCRASERNQSPNPLFHGLGANLCGEALRNARDQFFENLFFSQILAVIDARSRKDLAEKQILEKQRKDRKSTRLN